MTNFKGESFDYIEFCILIVYFSLLGRHENGEALP